MYRYIITILFIAGCDPHPPPAPESIDECVRRVSDRVGCAEPGAEAPVTRCGEDPRAWGYQLHAPGCDEAVAYCVSPARVGCEERATCRCEALAQRGAIAWEWWGVCVSEARRRCDPHFDLVQ